MVVAGERTLRPIGHAEFCRNYPEECGANTDIIDAVSLTETLVEQLAAINATINSSVRAMTDTEFYGVKERWAYPDKAGDCEDFVLAKRRALAEAGWPLSTLLIAVVRQKSGEGHAVLMVRTDRGDLVLDNLVPEVSAWNELPYTYVKRQSQENAGDWVALSDTRDIQLVAAHD